MTAPTEVADSRKPVKTILCEQCGFPMTYYGSNPRIYPRCAQCVAIQVSGQTRPSLYEVSFQINEVPEMKARRTWHIECTEAERWTGLVFEATRGKRPEKPLERARVTFFRYSRGQPRERGLVESFNPVLRALVSSHVLDSLDPEKVSVRCQHVPTQGGPDAISWIRISVVSV